MSNIHNNSVLQSVSTNRGMKPSEAQNESNGMGAAGYCYYGGEEAQDDHTSYVDRSDYLTSALVGLATLNSSRLFVNKGNLKKIAAKSAVKSLAKTA